LPALVVALAIALNWVLLLPIGLTGIWAGAFHVFLPGTAS
jgi:hypothetical protein